MLQSSIAVRSGCSLLRYRFYASPGMGGADRWVRKQGSYAVDATSLVPLESQKQIALLMNAIEKQHSIIAVLELEPAAAKTRADRAKGAVAQWRGVHGGLLESSLIFRAVPGSSRFSFVHQSSS